jgi:hypothetical protein
MRGGANRPQAMQAMQGCRHSRRGRGKVLNGQCRAEDRGSVTGNARQRTGHEDEAKRAWTVSPCEMLGEWNRGSGCTPEPCGNALITPFSALTVVRRGWRQREYGQHGGIKGFP